MIKAYYTEDYNEWVEYLQTTRKDVNFIFPDNAITVGKYCIAPQFECNNIAFQAITRMVGEGQLNEAIREFAVLYCVFKASLDLCLNTNYYLIRGVTKEKFDEMHFFNKMNPPGNEKVTSIEELLVLLKHRFFEPQTELERGWNNALTFVISRFEKDFVNPHQVD